MLFCSPVFLLAVSFFILDPFMIFHPYQNYYREEWFTLNRDFVSTERYLKTWRTSQYDSFIFGNSRSLAFLARDWQPFISENARPFHFDAFNESLFGILRKVQLIHGSGQPIRHALILLDSETLEQTKNHPNPMYIKHPSISGESWGAFYLTFLRSYFSDFFYLKYWGLKIFGPSSVAQDFFVRKHSAYFENTNDLYQKNLEDRIDREGDEYYKYKRIDSSKRSFLMHLCSTPQIKEPQLKMLREIAEIFKIQGTNYKIIINPLFNQVPLPHEDLSALRSLFGRENIYDYSGVNRFTSDIHNYYDLYHFRVRVAREIMKEIHSPAQNFERV